MSKLLPCPFCGGQPSYKNACGDDWLQCDNCHCMTEMRSGRVNLPDIWNTRTPDAQHKQVIAELVAIATEAKEDIRIYAKNEHPYADKYPSEAMKLKRDLDIVERIDAIIARAKALEVVE